MRTIHLAVAGWLLSGLASAFPDEPPKVSPAALDRLVLQLGDDGPVMSVALSPDGKRVLGGSSDRAMRLWDLETGAEILTIAGHPHTVWDVAISPDGKRALSGCSDGVARLWDLESVQLLKTL